MHCPHLTKSATEYKDMNFKVAPDFHYEFKKLAVELRMSNVELLRQAFGLFQRVNEQPRKH